ISRTSRCSRPSTPSGPTSTSGPQMASCHSRPVGRTRPAIEPATAIDFRALPALMTAGTGKSSMHSAAQLRYRADIDGMRAIAVIAVVLFHAYPKGLPGGFAGVDAFFVISGYLITSIIVGGLDGDGFSFADFYARRVRRLFPALIVVLIATLAAGFWILLPSQTASLAKNTMASAFFGANLMLWSETGYFDIDAKLKPLLHLWSLGIEEQFYLAWPLVLWLTPRRRRTTLIICTIVGSFALNVALIGRYPEATFY